ncbi:hypothetical protein BT69DRAFT_1339505 [Atractiella rhizophila]|nr:hypothetical protein BT69DRAFT_1339505 [Atractiella rhizophila]
MAKWWTDILTIWVEHKNAAKKEDAPSHRRPFGNLEESTPTADPFHDDKAPAPRTVVEIEATALSFLTSSHAPLRRLAITALRLAASLDEGTVDSSPKDGKVTRVIRVIENCGGMVDDVDEDLFAKIDKNRVSKWRKSKPLIKQLEVDSALDFAIWLAVLGNFFQHCFLSCPVPLSIMKSIFFGRFNRIQPIASSAAGLAGGRGVNGTVGKNPNATESAFMIDSWRACIIALCTLHFPTPNLPPDSERDPSVAQQESVIAKIMPFLVSDNSTIREAAIKSLGCVHPVLYQFLLNNLRHIVLYLGENDRSGGTTRTGVPKQSQRHVRLRSAIARVQDLCSPLLSRADHPVSETSISLVSDWLKEMHVYLREKDGPEDASTPVLRKGFCTVLKAMIDSPFTKNGLPRWISHDSKSDLFLMLQSWCFKSMDSSTPQQQNGRYNSPQSIAKSRSNPGAPTQPMVDVFLPAVMAIAALANIDVSRNDIPLKGIELGDVLRWAQPVLENPSSTRGPIYARQAIRGTILTAILTSAGFTQALDVVISHCFAETDNLGLGQMAFSVLSDLVLENQIPNAREYPPLTALLIYKLGHSDINTRYRAFELLIPHFPIESLSAMESIQSSVHTSFAGVSSAVQLRVSSMLPAFLRRQAYGIATEYVMRATAGIGRPRSMLRLIPGWLAVLDLVGDLEKGTPVEADPLLIKLFLLTVRFADNCYLEVREIWQSLISPTSPTLNQAAILKFIIDETTRRGTEQFLRAGRKIIASLCYTDGGALRLLCDLAELVDPAGMIAPADSLEGLNPSFLPPPSSRRNALDAQFPVVAKRALLSVSQAALLLSVDALVQQTHASEIHLPLFLHAFVMHADHPSSLLRNQAQTYLIYYMTVLKRSLSLGKSTTSETTSLDVAWKWRKFWDHEEPRKNSRGYLTNMEYLVQDVVNFMQQKYPDIARIWGEIAIDWAVSCPARHIACRSLQTFRLLSTPLDLRMMAPIISRLSTTAGDSNPEIQTFTREALYTISSAVPLIGSAPVEAWPQIFWTGYVFLESSNDFEFLEACIIVQDIQEKLDPCEPDVDEALANTRPAEWTDASANSIVRYVLLKGLRSGSTAKAAWGVVRTMLHNHVRAGSQALAGSLHLLFAACIPWAMQTLEDGTYWEEMRGFTTNLSSLAEAEDMTSISRVMTSFAKSKFRNKDDFLRQSLSCIREYFSPDIGQILHLYLGFLQNTWEWLRERTLTLLKVLCRLVDLSTIDTQDFGYDFLAPLIRLTTHPKFAPLAIEVLEDRLPRSEPAPIGMKGKTAFGVPSEAGWSVPDPDGASSSLRKKLKEQLDSFPTIGFDSMAPSPVEFAVEDYDEGRQQSDNKTQSDFGGSSHLGEMVSTLHDLSAFFDDNETSETSNRFSQGLGPAKAMAHLLSRRLRKRSYDMRAFDGHGLRLPSFREEPPIDEGDEEEARYDGSDSDSDWDERESTEVGHEAMEEGMNGDIVASKWIEEQSQINKTQEVQDETADGGRFSSFRFRRR